MSPRLRLVLTALLSVALALGPALTEAPAFAKGKDGGRGGKGGGGDDGGDDGRDDDGGDDDGGDDDGGDDDGGDDGDDDDGDGDRGRSGGRSGSGGGGGGSGGSGGGGAGSGGGGSGGRPSDGGGRAGGAGSGGRAEASRDRERGDRPPLPWALTAAATAALSPGRPAAAAAKPVRAVPPSKAAKAARPPAKATKAARPPAKAAKPVKAAARPAAKPARPAPRLTAPLAVKLAVVRHYGWTGDSAALEPDLEAARRLDIAAAVDELAALRSAQVTGPGATARAAQLERLLKLRWIADKLELSRKGDAGWDLNGDGRVDRRDPASLQVAAAKAGAAPEAE